MSSSPKSIACFLFIETSSMVKAPTRENLSTSKRSTSHHFRGEIFLKRMTSLSLLSFFVLTSCFPVPGA